MADAGYHSPPGIQIVAEAWIRRLEGDAWHAHQALSQLECLELAAVLRALLEGPSPESRGKTGLETGYPGHGPRLDPYEPKDRP